MASRVDRRSFLKTSALVAGVGVGACAMPAIAGATAVVAFAKPKRVELPNVQPGDTMTASFFNNLVDRVNELSEAMR